MGISRCCRHAGRKQPPDFAFCNIDHFPDYIFLPDTIRIHIFIEILYQGKLDFTSFHALYFRTEYLVDNKHIHKTRDDIIAWIYVSEWQTGLHSPVWGIYNFHLQRHVFLVDMQDPDLDPLIRTQKMVCLHLFLFHLDLWYLNLFLIWSGIHKSRRRHWLRQRIIFRYQIPIWTEITDILTSIKIQR